MKSPTYYYLHYVVGDNWCGRFGLWPFRSVAVSVCGRSGLWPFRFVAVPACGRFGLRPFRFVAVSVCGLSDCDRFGCGRFGLWPLWPVTSRATPRVPGGAFNHSSWRRSQFPFYHDHLGRSNQTAELSAVKSVSLASSQRRLHQGVRRYARAMTSQW